MIVTIALKMIVDAAFEQAGDPVSTNWCIAVHFFDLLFYSAACMQISFIMKGNNYLPLILSVHRVFYKWLFNLVGIVYACYAFIELSYINVPFKDYNVGMFAANYAISHTLLVLTAIVTYFLIIKSKNFNKSLIYV